MEFQTYYSSCSFTQTWTLKIQSWYVASCYVKGWSIKPGDVRLYVLDDNDKVIAEISSTPRMFEWIKADAFPVNSTDNKVLKVRCELRWT